MLKKCIQCGKDVCSSNSAVILVGDVIHWVHLGLCNAKLHLAHPEIAKRNDIDPAFLEKYINDREK